MGAAVQLNFFADQGGIAGEVAAPQTIANDDYRWRIGTIFFREKATANGRFDSHNAEESFGHLKPAHSVGFRSAREIEARIDTGVTGDRFEGAAVIFPVLEHQRGDRVEVAALELPRGAHQ